MTSSILIDQHTYLQQRQHWLQDEWSGAASLRQEQESNRLLVSPYRPPQYQEAPGFSDSYYAPPLSLNGLVPVQYLHFGSSGIPIMHPVAPPWTAQWDLYHHLNMAPDHLSSLATYNDGRHSDYGEEVLASTGRNPGGLTAKVDEQDGSIEAGPTTAGTRLAEEYLNFPLTATSSGSEFDRSDETDSSLSNAKDAVSQTSKLSKSEDCDCGQDRKVEEGLSEVDPNHTRLMPTIDSDLPLEEERHGSEGFTRRHSSIRDTEELRKAVLQVSSQFYAGLAEILVSHLSWFPMACDCVWLTRRPTHLQRFSLLLQVIA